MRTLLAVVAITALTTTTNLVAQTEKGSLYVGGGSDLNMSFSKSTFEGQSERKTSSFGLSPSVQYFVANNFAIGLSLPYSFSSSKIEDTRTVNNNIGIAPSLTYLFGSNNLKPYVSAQFNINKYFSSTTVSGNKDKSDGEGSGLNVGGGLAYFFKERLAMNVGVYYGYADLSNNDFTQNGVALRAGFMFRINK